MNFKIKRQLKRTSIVTNSMLVALCFVAVSCTKVELDEKERALVAKQELANNFDKLFDEAFEKPDETEQKLKTFVFSDLVSDGKNLLTDQDIRVNETLIKMAIRLKRNQNTLEQELNKGSLYDGYVRKNHIIINCKSVLYELPYRARQGAKYERLQAKVAEIEGMVGTILKKRESALGAIPTELLNKQWKWTFDLAGHEDELPDLYTGDYKGLKDLSFDFHFNKNNTITAKRFFLAPIIVDYSLIFDSAGDWKQELMTEESISCFVYNNKIFFRVPMKDNANTFTGRGNVAHEWYYEYTYSVNGNELTLSEPRITLYVMVNLRTSDYNSEMFENNYYADFKSFTLTAQ